MLPLMGGRPGGAGKGEMQGGGCRDREGGMQGGAGSAGTGVGGCREGCG